jgi:hypothetical protein
MSAITPRNLNRLLLCALTALSLAACDDTPPETEECQHGRAPNGDCFLAPDASDVTEDVEQDDDTNGVDCTPGDFRCATATSMETCGPNGDRWEEQTCGDGLICRESRCVPGETCEPGSVAGCRTPTSQRICADDAVSYGERRCPDDTPNCFQGDCIEGACNPDAVFCDGEDRMRCDASGEDATLIETCEYACTEGACVDPPDQLCTEKSYIGCEFWAVDLDNYTKRCSTTLDCSIGSCQGNVCVEEDANRQQFAISVSNIADEPVSVDVVGPNGSTAASTMIGVGELQRIQLPQRDSLDTSRHKNAFRVSATGPITVHQFNPESNLGVFSNDASMLLPTNALGREYRVVGWPTLEQPTLARYPSTNKAYVTIVAAEPGQTFITVETPVDLQAGGDVPAIPADSSRNFTLTQGMVLQLATVANSSREYDLTGLNIMSSKKVAVFSAHECAFVPTDTPACDHLEQQLIPTSTWGTEYVAPKFAPRGREDDIFRVLAAEDGTELTTQPAIDGVDGHTLDTGEFVEFATDRSFALSATRPVSVAQYMVGALYPGPVEGCDPASGVEFGCLLDKKVDCTVGDETFEFPIGDPAFTFTVPTSQFRSDYVVLTPEGYRDDYLSVVAPTDAAVTVDGSPLSGVTNEIPGTGWAVTWVDVEPGMHTLTGDQPFGLYSYGYECFVSYAFPGGLNLSPVR